MKVTVKLISYLQSTMGSDQIKCELPPGSTIVELLVHLQKSTGKEMFANKSMLCLVNDISVAIDTVLKEKDCVLLIPPIAGG